MKLIVSITAGEVRIATPVLNVEFKIHNINSIFNELKPILTMMGADEEQISGIEIYMPLIQAYSLIFQSIESNTVIEIEQDGSIKVETNSKAGFNIKDILSLKTEFMNLLINNFE